MSPKLLWLVLFSLGLYLSVAGVKFNCTKRPKRVSIKTCCPIPNFNSDEVKQKCKWASKSPHKDTGRRNKQHQEFPTPCFMSCIFNETGIFVNNKLDRKGLHSHLKKTYPKSAQLQVMYASSFSGCAAKAASRGKATPGLSDDGPFCSDDAAFIFRCVIKNTFNTCPASMWNNKALCNNWRTYVHNCEN